MRNKALGRRGLALVLALMLTFALSPGASAAAGDQSDPLVSGGYLVESYLPELLKKMEALVSERASQTAGGVPGVGTVRITAGGSITLAEGQTVLLLEGAARLAIDRGAVVNASVGFEAVSGVMNLYQKYIVCEDSAVTVSVSQDSGFAVSGGAVVKQGAGKASPFTDVRTGAWYFDDVLAACERGLVNGMSASRFEPAGLLTCAQAVKLAACMHQLYHTGAVSLKNSTDGAWYRSYVDYAQRSGLLSGEFLDYNAAITRLSFVELFYKALPDMEYGAQNEIADGAIPDVRMSDACAAEIYTFYRAGILTGYTGTDGYAEHAFGAASTITRAEVAAIMNRMFDAEARQSVYLG